MASGHFRMDLGVVGQGLHLLVDFGFRPLEEMARVAELLEHSIYARGSLRRVGGRASFTLLNPPLRMGAFDRVTVRCDGRLLPPETTTVDAGSRGAARALADVSRARPLDLPVGEPTRFEFDADALPPGPHRVRLELQSVAIPPLVWLEFTDHLMPADAP
jgi:hypothetical protein